MILRSFLLVLVGAALLLAQTAILPLADVKPGMRGVGRSIFQGDRIEEFQAEILGVLRNVGPKQSIILARLSGGPLAETGVLQGMSGSPVYIDGKLIGAVALSFPFSKEPIAGIRPAEEMLQSSPSPTGARPVQNSVFEPASLLPQRQEYAVGNGRMAEIATPFWMSGFTRATFEHFAPAWRAAGLEPVQGLSGGGPSSQALGDPSLLKPGSMISVQLVSGDLNAGADGTVTWIDGKKIYAFGHQFMSTGDTDLPFARSEVMALLPSQNISFKIASPQEWLGTIIGDRSAAVVGELGRRARLLPVTIRINSHSDSPQRREYRMNLVRDRLLTPLLLQMAVFSAIDASERTAGLSTIALKGSFSVEGAPAPIPLNQMYSGELGAPQQVSAAIAYPVMAILQSGFTGFELRGVDLEMDIWNEKRQVQLDGVWTSRRDVRPGESVDITASFRSDSGKEITRTTKYTVPIGVPEGTLYFTVADAPAVNLAEYRQFLVTPPRTSEQLLSFLNGLRTNTRAYVRVWRGQPSYQVVGETLPAPPPSLQLILGRQSAQAAGSRIAELDLPGGEFLFTGSKTVQVEVKE